MAAADRQRAYRERQAQERAETFAALVRLRSDIEPRFAAAHDALERIIARLDGNDKPLAVEIRKIAQEALGIEDSSKSP